jgi:hypothetical protein
MLIASALHEWSIRRTIEARQVLLSRAVDH